MGIEEGDEAGEWLKHDRRITGGNWDFNSKRINRRGCEPEQRFIDFHNETNNDDGGVQSNDRSYLMILILRCLGLPTRKPYYRIFSQPCLIVQSEC